MANIKEIKTVCFGEVLYDVFADEKKLGGAPLNVALRLKTLGCDASMISCVGNDKDGVAIVQHVRNLGLDTDGIIRTNDYPTGLVQVFINERGSASYDIAYPSAWDKIVLNDHARKLVSDAHALIFGSLVCRDEVSRNALNELLNYNVFKVFDVNLRKPHYSLSTLIPLMEKADFIKFNDEEILEIAAEMGCVSTVLEDNIAFIAEHTETKSICVTRGRHGATLMLNNNLFYSNGYPVNVCDTVGAGDSFLAAVVAGVLKGWNPQWALNFACAVGGLVASYPGANPEISYLTVEKMMKE